MVLIDDGGAEIGQLQNAHTRKSQILVCLSRQVALMVCIAIPATAIQSLIQWSGLLAAEQMVSGETNRFAHLISWFVLIRKII